MMTENTITLILLFVLWVLYAAMEGIRHAWLAYNRPEDSPPNNPHPLYFAQRFCVGMMCMGGVVEIHSFTLETLWFLAAIALSFPFIHEALYYAAWDELDPNHYPRGIFSTPRTSNAKMNFGPITRMVMLIAGITCLILSL